MPRADGATSPGPAGGGRAVAAFQAVGVALVAAGALATLAVLDPNQPGHYPTCPSLLLTGFYCPGCGTLRCLHALTQGDLATAVHMNVLAVAFLPYLAWSWIAWVRRDVFGGPARRLGPAWRIWALGVLVLTYWVVRNLPPFSFLAPGRW